MLFLRADPERTGVPVVGVDQGFFRIVEDAGREALQDADGNYVVGVGEGGVVVRRGDDKQGVRRPVRVPAPTPDPGYRQTIAIRSSAGVDRYLHSTDEPWTPARFLDAVRAVLDRP